MASRGPDAGPVAASIRHLLDLARFFPAAAAAWPDTLATETRRHVAGCLATMETALLLELAHTAAAPALPALPAPLLWPAIQNQSQLLSADLMAHMRLRAAVGLLGRQSMRTGGDDAAAPAPEPAWTKGDAASGIADAAAAVALAEGRWAATGSEDAAMRADLPAEHYSELLWTAAALIGAALARSALISAPTAIAAVAWAATELLARHDEENTAFGQAALLARLMRGHADFASLLSQAIGQRRYLLFAALAGEWADIGTEAALETLVQGPVERLAGLCHALGGAPSDFRHLLADLMPVRGAIDDVTLVALADAYDRMTPAEADSELAILRQPAPLRAKLAQIGVLP